MGKLLQTRAKRRASTAAKKSPKRLATRTGKKNDGAKPTLRQLNAWLTRNQKLVVQMAKENTLRLIGRDKL